MGYAVHIGQQGHRHKEKDTARFTPGEACEHNGRPATIGGYKTDDKGSTRYHIFYTDAKGGVVFDLLGRVLSKVAV